VDVLGVVRVAETFWGAARANDPGVLVAVPKDQKLPLLREYKRSRPFLRLFHHRVDLLKIPFFIKFDSISFVTLF